MRDDVRYCLRAGPTVTNHDLIWQLVPCSLWLWALCGPCVRARVSLKPLGIGAGLLFKVNNNVANTLLPVLHALVLPLLLKKPMIKQRAGGLA